MRVVVTGATGFIGQAVARKLSGAYEVIGCARREPPRRDPSFPLERADVTDRKSLAGLFRKHVPDVVVHAAGLAHRPFGGAGEFRRVNGEAVELTAGEAASANGRVLFIHLSSVSVYGPHCGEAPINEETALSATDPYGSSKIDGEKGLLNLCEQGSVQSAIILRLAPLYDREWTRNLERRVKAPGAPLWLRFGDGSQRISALARPNLVDFVSFLLAGGTVERGARMMNVCDERPYSFNEIQEILRASGRWRRGCLVSLPLPLLRSILGGAAWLYPQRSPWFRETCGKLAAGCVVDCRRMAETGFRHRHSLATIFPGLS